MWDQGCPPQWAAEHTRTRAQGPAGGSAGFLKEDKGLSVPRGTKPVLRETPSPPVSMLPHGPASPSPALGPQVPSPEASNPNPGASLSPALGPSWAILGLKVLPPGRAPQPVRFGAG